MVTASAADVRKGKVIVGPDGEPITGTMPEQGAITLNPGTTAKTGATAGKYMTGNVTVPAINISAAHIKKGQVITFPDGSKVTGTFEGYVPVATDLYYRGVNVNGFTGDKYAHFGDLYIEQNDPQPSAFRGFDLYSGAAVNLRGFTKVNILFDVTLSHRPGYSPAGVELGVYQAPYTSTSRDDPVAEAALTADGTHTGYTLSVDVSNLTGNYYVGLQTRYPDYSATSGLKVYRIWLS